MYMQGDVQARLGLAQAYEDLKDDNDAITQYQRVLELSPKDKVALQKIHDIINSKKKKQGAAKRPLKSRK
jgi:cytochrome c-type biogenesis protein CcmH/NrfG